MSNQEAEILRSTDQESILDPISAEALAESLDQTGFGHLVFDALLRRRATRSNPPAHHIQLTPHGRSNRPALMDEQRPAVPLPTGNAASAEQQAQINGALGGAAAMVAGNGTAELGDVQQSGQGQVPDDVADEGGASAAVDGAAANVANLDLSAPPASPQILTNALQNERLMSTINGRLGPLSNTNGRRSPSFWGSDALRHQMGGSNSTSRVPDQSARSNASRQVRLPPPGQVPPASAVNAATGQGGAHSQVSSRPTTEEHRGEPAPDAAAQLNASGQPLHGPVPTATTNSVMGQGGASGQVSSQPATEGQQNASAPVAATAAPPSSLPTTANELRRFLERHGPKSSNVAGSLPVSRQSSQGLAGPPPLHSTPHDSLVQPPLLQRQQGLSSVPHTRQPSNVVPPPAEDRVLLDPGAVIENWAQPGYAAPPAHDAVNTPTAVVPGEECNGSLPSPEFFEAMNLGKQRLENLAQHFNTQGISSSFLLQSYLKTAQSVVPHYLLAETYGRMRETLQRVLDASGWWLPTNVLKAQIDLLDDRWSDAHMMWLVGGSNDFPSAQIGPTVQAVQPEAQPRRNLGSAASGSENRAPTAQNLGRTRSIIRQPLSDLRQGGQQQPLPYPSRSSVPQRTQVQFDANSPRIYEDPVSQESAGAANSRSQGSSGTYYSALESLPAEDGGGSTHGPRDRGTNNWRSSSATGGPTEQGASVRFGSQDPFSSTFVNHDWPPGWEIDEEEVTAMRMRDLKDSIPKFNGEGLNYRSFRVTFKSAVHANKCLTILERTTLLEKCLEEHHVNLVGAFPTSSIAEYAEMLAALDENFSDTAVESFERALRALPMIDSSRLETVTSLIGLLKQASRSLDAADCKMIHTHALRKLGDHKHSYWNANQTRRNVVTMHRWLSRFHQVESSSIVRPANPSRARFRNQIHVHQDAPQAQCDSDVEEEGEFLNGEQQSFVLEMRRNRREFKWDENQDPCPIDGEKHYLSQCPKFYNEMNLQQRLDAVAKFSRCKRCFSPFHGSVLNPGPCKFKQGMSKCEVCGSCDHHTLLHNFHPTASLVSLSTDKILVDLQYQKDLEFRHTAECTLRQGVVRIGNPETGLFVCTNCLLDCCCSRTQGHIKLAKMLGLKGPLIDTRTTGAGGMVHSSKGILAMVEISDLEGTFTVSHPIRFIDSPAGDIEFVDWRQHQNKFSYLQDIDLPEPVFHEGLPDIPIIVGNDLACLMKLKDGSVQRGADSPLSPLAENTKVGWTVAGFTSPDPPAAQDLMEGKALLLDNTVVLARTLSEPYIPDPDAVAFSPSKGLSEVSDLWSVVESLEDEIETLEAMVSSTASLISSTDENPPDCTGLGLDIRTAFDLDKMSGDSISVDGEEYRARKLLVESFVEMPGDKCAAPILCKDGEPDLPANHPQVAVCMDQSDASIDWDKPIIGPQLKRLKSWILNCQELNRVWIPQCQARHPDEDPRFTSEHTYFQPRPECDGEMDCNGFWRNTAAYWTRHSGLEGAPLEDPGAIDDSTLHVPESCCHSCLEGALSIQSVPGAGRQLESTLTLQVSRGVLQEDQFLVDGEDIELESSEFGMHDDVPLFSWGEGSHPFQVQNGFCEIVLREFHVFSDASRNTLGAVYYSATYSLQGPTCVRQLFAKVLIAPKGKQEIKTIPRLELCASLIGTEVAKKVASASELKDARSDFHFWSDSVVSLLWIPSSKKRKQYVSNRVQQILNVTDPDQWRSVEGASDPADMVSRGSMSVAELKRSDLRWHGPPWLYQSPELWPRNLVNVHPGDEALKEMMLQFWDRWQSEHLHGIMGVPKWMSGQVDIKPGHLVMVLDKDDPKRKHKIKWPTTRVEQVDRNQDGKIQSCQIKYKKPPDMPWS